MIQALERLARADVSELAELLGADLESSTRHRLGTVKAAPSGEPWPEWSAAYAARRPARGGLLELEGQLIDTIRYELDGLSVSVGSPMVYALTHQLGDRSRGIPERPYLGISDDDRETLQETTNAWIERVMEGSA